MIQSECEVKRREETKREVEEKNGLNLKLISIDQKGRQSATREIKNNTVNRDVLFRK